MTKTRTMTKRIDEVTFILRQLLATIEAAEAEAADTEWQDEQEDILSGMLNDIASRCDNLAYAMRHEGSVLTKHETEGR